MISFTCDYNEGAHPLILQRLLGTNMQQENGYGFDSFTQSAKQKIRDFIGCPDADIFFLVGGTQTNSTIIDGVLPHYSAVIAAETGHIAVHESGAVELFGHKVITLPSHEGKLVSTDLVNYLQRFYADPTWQHMAHPDMVYISFPTEYGTIYSRQELEEIYNICKEYKLLLFVDGARLGYGLASYATDVDIKTLSRLCDVFYIGGTKIGALCGEAVVFPQGNAPSNFFTIIKQHGALLAKGRLLGLQFETLFTDNLYLSISRNAIDVAMQLKDVFLENNIKMYIDSPTNQQFPILTQQQIEKLSGKVEFEIWEQLDDNHYLTRFATSWATPSDYVEVLRNVLSR